ncbi:carboxypeptidase-like regulatory domain-containing protein [Macellibacteroides fermentans]|uniref:CarboxypepD_reg-like domain-containing protein n=1 Tax=Parabacteroides chartae TaxID=1037355 RepID=A0A1T4ZW48_9BACT|nr:carboxypeptidase-like regulatory domain-containing protein [Parabacteroides chartae]SKB26689.1 CarboxypepD_reg-like domain-containing protein [Parabacteroides chartae]
MKTRMYFLFGYLMTALLLLSSYPLQAQEEGNYFIVSGTVKDKQTKKKLEYVNISVPGTNVGTITNSDGEFTIKVQDSLQAKVVEISHIGYYNYRIALTGNDMVDENVMLTQNANVLEEVVVRAHDPRMLIEEAMNRIGKNYSEKPTLLTGFYRETAQKGKRYINISEAIIDVYKTPYDEDASRDRVQIFKGRALLSQKASDTLIVKLLGGPNLSLYVDIVKNPDILLDKTTLGYFSFRMEESVVMDNRPQYVISFQPQAILPYALHYGKLYIDKESLAFTRAEFNLNMEDRDKATSAILKKKPAGLRFRPVEVSFLVTYKQVNGKSYLNYIRNEVRFKCDWKRRLFSTNYAMVSEMVVTDSKDQAVNAIPYKMSFKSSQSLSDKVSDFRDENFWGSYNIIEPTESLEKAANKLRKQQE